jgi:hypothetical protein|tara:strand:+ start:4227 stop:4421 length:195 start_codon:yes stop_codon:yes gene_type:complete
MLGFMLVGWLFTVDNQEFFDAVAADRAVGKKWEFVGVQPVPKNGVSIPITSLSTGEDIILFSIK